MGDDFVLVPLLLFFLRYCNCCFLSSLLLFQKRKLVQTVAGAVVVARVDKTSPPSLAAAGKKVKPVAKMPPWGSFLPFQVNNDFHLKYDGFIGSFREKIEPVV